MTDTNAGPARVALIGYGLAGSVFHAPLIASTEGLHLDTVVTSAPARQAKAAAEHPQARVVASADEVWARATDLDLVVVASTNRTHVPLATAALEAGLAVVVDKPLAGSAEEGRSLARLAAKKGLMLSVFQNRRWDADFLTLRHLIEAGDLGDVWRLESRFERWRPQPGAGWRESADPLDVGGLLYDLGSHLVDQVLVLFGPARSVYAEVMARRPGAQVDDDNFVALEHENGVRSHLWMSAAAAQFGPRFRALGSKAGYVKFGLDPQEPALAAGERPGRDWGAEPPEAWGWLGVGSAPGTGTGRTVPSLHGDYPAFYRGIAEALGTGGPPPVAVDDAINALTVLEAARLSAQERAVRLVSSGQ